MDKVREKVRRFVRATRFRRFAAEAKKLHAMWEQDFSPVSLQFLHPLWQKSRLAFASLIQSGVTNNFLHHPEVTYQFCRTGFGKPQEHELAYLKSRPRDLSEMIRKYEESTVGCPAIDCPELQISVNSLGMLYYFARMAEQLDVSSLDTIVEFGGGYGCLCRVFQELLPRRPAYVIVDLPEMLALQYVFLRASAPQYRIVPHTSAPTRIEAGTINLVPVHLAPLLSIRPDLFVSTFAISETPQRVQDDIARQGFFHAKATYLAGQETDAQLWRHIGLESSQALHRAVHDNFSHVRIQPFHYASAWELFASQPKTVLHSSTEWNSRCEAER